MISVLIRSVLVPLDRRGEAVSQRSSRVESQLSASLRDVSHTSVWVSQTRRQELHAYSSLDNSLHSLSQLLDCCLGSAGDVKHSTLKRPLQCSNRCVYNIVDIHEVSGLSAVAEDSERLPSDEPTREYRDDAAVLAWELSWAVNVEVSQ